eukprot:6861311-Lingulodinium_polyedra.AAC.1
MPEHVEKARKAVKEYRVHRGPLDDPCMPPSGTALEAMSAIPESWQPSTARQPADEDPNPDDLPPGTDLA